MNRKIKNIFWQTCVKYLQSTIPIKNFIEYICPLQIYIEENKFIILSPNNYIKEKIEKTYLSIIKNIIQNISDEKYDIKVIIGSLSQYKKIDINIEEIHKKELLKNINSFIKSAILMTLKTPGTLYNPIFIYEEKSTNKYNLINFITNKLNNINYIIIKNEIKDIEEYLKNNDVLIIEEIQLIKLNSNSQKKLKNLLELMIKNKKQIIITANECLQKIKNINHEIKNIISYGLTIKIDKNKKNVKTKKQISVDKIIKSVLIYYNIDIEKIKNKKRQKSIVLIRQIIFYLCKTLTNKTFSEISSYIGDYTNANIIYAYNKIKKLIEKDNNIKYEIQNIKTTLIK